MSGPVMRYEWPQHGVAYKRDSSPAMLQLSLLADLSALLFSLDATALQCAATLLMVLGLGYLALSAAYGALSRCYTVAAVRGTCC
jgi:hypothetical protein